MNIIKNDLKVVFLWSIIAYVAGSIPGNLAFFLLDFSNVSFGLALITLLVPYLLIYGFCGFKAVASLKGKTKLSWLKIAGLFFGFVWLYGVLWRIAYLTMGHDVPGSGNLLVFAAILLGAYTSHKNLFSSKKK
ncbi:hypothetical protein HYV83_01940 [Candidatus Woesearchaeota archaeon]|nr:hypothetical protein [Candidatus Woesearchaeota archaeon]